MKKYILIFGLFITLTFFTGCYTVVWSPDQDFPTEENYQEEYYEDAYYMDSYYGGYGYYYQYPWWLSVTPPSYSGPSSTTERSDNPSMERTRGNDGSRNSGSDGRIINNTPVTRSGSSNSGSTSGSNSGTSRDTKVSTDSNKGSSNNGSSTAPSRSSSSGSNDTNRTRNNDGGRSSSGGRK